MVEGDPTIIWPRTCPVTRRAPIEDSDVSTFMRELYIEEVMLGGRTRKKKSAKRTKKKNQDIHHDVGPAEMHYLRVISDISDDSVRVMESPLGENSMCIEDIEKLHRHLLLAVDKDITETDCHDFMKALACVEILCSVEVIVRTMLIIRRAHKMYNSSHVIDEGFRQSCIQMLGPAEEHARTSAPHYQYYIAVAARLLDCCSRGDGIYMATSSGWSNEDLERWDAASCTACPLCTPRVAR